MPCKALERRRIMLCIFRPAPCLGELSAAAYLLKFYTLLNAAKPIRQNTALGEKKYT